LKGQVIANGTLLAIFDVEEDQFVFAVGDTFH
jgi:hypothetical protein